MALASFPPLPVLKPDPDTGLLIVRESCGLDHRRQIVEIACPPDISTAHAFFGLQDHKTGWIFPAQRSQQDTTHAFLQLELRARENFELRATNLVPTAPLDAVTLTSQTGNHSLVSNGKWTAEIFLGEWKFVPGAAPSLTPPTPIHRVRVKTEPWRGSSFFDTRQPVSEVSSRLLESGPLRIVALFQARTGLDFTYTARLTFDAGSDFIEIIETFAGDRGDQIVWDFSGDDLPHQLCLLDSTAGFTTQNPPYFFDKRLARLACWNQYSQLHDYSDGYALTFFQSDDVLGFVALRGGDWDGNAHNFLEAWTRRWFPGDPSSRRLVPPEAKADASPSPEQVPGRPVNRYEPHFSIEGWLHQGRRHFALVLTNRDSLHPPDWNAAPPLGPFEMEPDRARYRQQQGLLRRIHTQHGMFSLADQLALDWYWPMEIPPGKIIANAPPWENPATLLPHENLSITERINRMFKFLEARVFGFWEGSGSAYTNAVVSRPLAHYLLDWEWLTAHGHLTPEQITQGRAWFAFLIQLFSSDHFYPGAASMNMGASSLTLEPTMAGMANQNFFTDVFNMPGMAAQVFSAHPQADEWRDRFSRMWARQLEYHVYPESGVWEESHTYFHHVLQTVIPTLERRLEDGVEDGFTSLTFQCLVASLLKMLTPRDACFGGQRHIVALGDHGIDLKDLYRPLYRNLAHHLMVSNPDLAAQLAWAYREMGGTESLNIEPQRMQWQNEYVQGLGYFFRSEDARGESLFVLRCGNAWAHHHNDEGSIQLVCAGRSWIVDSAFSYPQKQGIRKVRADGHSRWTPRDLDPLNYLWQFNRGWITHHQQDGPFPYAIAFTPVYMAEASWQQYTALRVPILHWRCVVQLAPSAYLILDRTNIDLPQLIRFHIPLDAPLALEDAPAPVGTHLRLRSVLGLEKPHLPNIDYPTQVPERYATQEILYPLGGSPLTACLVLVEEGAHPLPIEITRTPQTIVLQHADFSAELVIDNPAETILINARTGKRATLHLREETTSQPQSGG